MTSLFLDTGDEGGSYVVRDGRVVGRATQAPPGAGTLDCRDAAVAPGFVNAHTHLYSGLAPLGMPAPADPPQTFVQILERVWWRLDRALDAASLRASARHYVAEALLAGTTTLVDHHESPAFLEGSLDVLADACAELGARALLCYGATERNGGRDEGRRGLSECKRFLEGNRRPLVRGLVGLHASFTVSDETVREAGALCRAAGSIVHVHVAEDGADVEDARRRGFAGPLERLLELGALPRGSIVAHGVHLGEAQVHKADEAGLWIVQNPRSNRGNRVGYPGALSASSRVALGTDGYPADMRAEGDLLREEALAHGDDAAGRFTGGWRLAAEQAGIGSAMPWQPGAAADLVVLERTRGNAPQRIRHVLVGGRLVVQDGKLVSGDRDAIRAEAQEQASRLWKRMEAL